jgi:hypothetical protein
MLVVMEKMKKAKNNKKKNIFKDKSSRCCHCTQNVCVNATFRMQNENEE